jgi:thermolysin
MFTANIDLPDEPKVSAEEALKIVLKHEPANKERPGDAPILQILNHEGKRYLVWHITVSGGDISFRSKKPIPARWEYFIDALTGKIVWRYNNIQSHAITVGTGVGRYSGNVNLNTVHDHATNKYKLEDRTMSSSTRLYTHGGLPPASVSEKDTNDWSAADDGPETDGHFYSRVVYDYFLSVHGRNSYDNAGGEMHIYVHCGNDNNAYWNGNEVLIYDGDGGIDFTPFCTLDIIAHEWTHAVTEHTANLIYNGEAGAMNESISDVFAAFIDGDWLQGEDNWVNKAEAPAGRNLADPTNGGKYNPADPITSVINGHQPDHMNDKYTGTMDYGGVHINSGIMNKAAYLMATGGTHRGIKICTGLGNDVLGRLYYHALCNHLVPTSNFSAMRNAILDSLLDLFSSDAKYATWKASVTNAFAAVGIGSSVTCPKVLCYISPVKQCKIAPIYQCKIAPIQCKLGPILCKIAPIHQCKLGPTCKIAPIIDCKAAPKINCTKGPIVGCLPGPDPINKDPRIPEPDPKIKDPKIIKKVKDPKIFNPGKKPR